MATKKKTGKPKPKRSKPKPGRSNKPKRKTPKRKGPTTGNGQSGVPWHRTRSRMPPTPKPSGPRLRARVR